MVILLVITIPAAALGTPAAQQGGNFMVSVAGTAAGSIPHQIDLKVTQLPGGQLSEVTGFVVGPEDVVQVGQGENIVVSTSADLKTHKVKVTNTQGQLLELLPLSSNTWSLQVQHIYRRINSPSLKQPSKGRKTSSYHINIL